MNHRILIGPALGALGIGVFLQRFPRATLATNRFEWDPLILSRSLKRLPVRLG